MAAIIEQKVDSLEAVLGEFIVHTQRSFIRLEREMRVFKDEMKEFKDEMKEFKDEMKEFKDEMKEFKDEMKEFKDEMKEFKDEMSGFKNEVRNENKTMKRQWAELTDKLGSFAEDIALPNIPRIAVEDFKENTILTVMNNVRKRNIKKHGDEYEFDGIVETENMVFLLEAKFTARMEIFKILPKLVENFKAVFPEYGHKELVVIFGSMSIPDNMVKKLTNLGIYAMSLGDDNMDLLNFKEIQDRKK